MDKFNKITLEHHWFEVRLKSYISSQCKVCLIKNGYSPSKIIYDLKETVTKIILNMLLVHMVIRKDGASFECSHIYLNYPSKKTEF